MDTVIMFANKLELRYYFNDKSGYIDAVVKNKCEREVLALMRSINELLDAKALIYSEPYPKEGSYCDLFLLAGRNSYANSTLLDIVIQLMTLPAEANSQLSPEEEKKIIEELQLLKQQLKQKGKTVDVSSGLINYLGSQARYCRNKSLFYEAVKSYSKITRIVFKELNENNHSRSGTIGVKREQFDDYIHKTGDMGEDKYLAQMLQADKRQLDFEFFDE